MQRFAAATLRDVLYYEASFGRCALNSFIGNFVPKAKGEM